MTVLEPPIDAATRHPYAFVFMTALMLVFGAVRVAKGTKASVKWKSFLHFWMFAYLLTLAMLMSITTAMALVLLVDEKGLARVTFIPASFISMAAAVFGVFGFEVLFSKFIIGFGETKLDLSTTLQNLIDQAVAATLKKEVGG
jgi:hypothetical protein